MVDVLRKSMGKMSPAGLAMVARVPLPADVGALVAEASMAAPTG
jgi:hypothetical protein